MMPRQPGVSRFPSMDGFMGEKPTKRPRIQDAQKGRAVPEMSLPAPCVPNDEVWDDLDDDAVEECMILATQMCTDPPENQKIRASSTNDHNGTFSLPKCRKDTTDPSGDTGFSSTRGTMCLDSSKVFHNSVKSRGSTTHQLDSSGIGNSYGNRFHDFTSLSNSQRLSNTSKTSKNFGKVYNSIPLKVSGIGQAIQGTSAISSGTSKVNDKDESKAVSKMTNIDKVKLEEEVLLKQGEISLLRAELKRKETALEAERLDRCSIIEAAEKRGREKAAAVSSEAEAKLKKSNITIETLQDELHFKNREVQELETQCRRLESQVQQKGMSPSQKNREPTSMKRSPSRPSSTFKNRFDFGGTISNVITKNIQVQTDPTPKEGRLRPRPKLNVTFSKGKGQGNRKIACLLTPGVKERTESLTSKKSWNLDDEWTGVLSKIITNYEDCDDVQKQLLSLSIQRLEELHMIFTSERVDSLKPPISKSSEAVDFYEGQIIPVLSLIKGLSTAKCENQLGRAIQAVCSHLDPLSFKDVVVNKHHWSLVLQALGHLSRITTFQFRAPEYQLMAEKLRDSCEGVDDSQKLVTLLQVLQSLTHHKNFTNILCSSEGNCLISKLCLVINSQAEDVLLVTATLQEWLAMIIMDSPDWLRSNCSCPAKLLAVLLKQIHCALDPGSSSNGSLKSEVSKLLIPTIRLLHCWSTKDLKWWEKVAYLPHYTAVMGTIINNAGVLKIDRQTVDLMCDLYEFDDKIFDSC